MLPIEKTAALKQIILPKMTKHNVYYSSKSICYIKLVGFLYPLL
jgi:hypothetical protein